MRRKSRKRDDDDNGFGAWGGYMEAKKAKLSEQFTDVTIKQADKKSNIFHGVSILVNGYTRPSADELKLLMAQHGGQYHLYQNQQSATTHIIATNLPNVKINQIGNIPVVNPQWIVESIDADKLLDFKKYLLYTNHSRTQPKLNFPLIDTETDKIQINQVKTKTASDPEFLSEFYNHSRLHLISTLGAEFKQLVNKLREESTELPGLKKLMLANKINSSTLKSKNIIMHIDMDCFFVSVGLRKHPELCGKPIAVTHSRNGVTHNTVNRQIEVDLYAKLLPDYATPKVNLLDNKCSMSEIASCSYEARRCGIKNGMFFGTALKLCPSLIPIPYDFEGYKEVSSILYYTIAEYTVDIEAVSCDEMYVNVTKILQDTGMSIEEWATHIRSEISERTGCPCSTGFGANRLQARVATKKAKPNGQYYLEPDDVENYIYELPFDELPGVGWATVNKLNKLGLKRCGDIHNVSLATLKNELGQKNSETIYNQARGIDEKPLNYEHERKSVSAEINYGIRFKSKDEALTFFESLSREVHNRLTEVKMKSKTITLKLLIRHEDAPIETAKFLGHGFCNSINKSTTINHYLDSPQMIFKEVKTIYNRLNIVDEDLRGVGIQLSKLEKITSANKGLTKFLNQQTSIENPVIQINGNNNIKEDNKREVKTDQVQLDSKSKLNVKDRGKTVIKKGKSKKSTNISQNTTGNISDFFKSNKNNDRKQLNKLSNIDLNVLKELPKELQDEIIKEYKLEETMNNKIVSKTETNIPSTSSTRETLKNDKIKTNKKGFADLTKEELKSCLKRWIKDESIPKDFDIDMLGNFFKLLVQDRKIEYLFSIINLLHRHIQEKSCDWHKAYFKLLNDFQEIMLLTYGNTLMVPNGFPCKAHC